MPATLEWNDAWEDAVREAAARRLLAAALFAQEEGRKDVSRGNPAPHDQPAPKGEYPKLRTGHGRAAIVLDTYSLAAVKRTLRVRIGYRRPNHLALLGARGWLWLRDTLRRISGRLAAKLAGGGSVREV